MADDRPKIDIELREAAKDQSIDLDNPANAFTVWSVADSDRIYCGSRVDEKMAWELARSLIHLRRLYILPADSTEFAIEVSDSDRRLAPHPRIGR